MQTQTHVQTQIKPFMSIRQAARTTGIREYQLRQMYKNGALPGFHSGAKFNVDVPRLTQVIHNALHKQGISKESSSRSVSTSSTEDESSDEDIDPIAEDAVTYEEFFKRTFPGHFKELLSQWVGFAAISVKEIRQYLSSPGPASSGYNRT